MLSAVQKLFGYKASKKRNDSDHFIDLYWKFLNDMDGSKSDYEREFEDLANYHRIMKTFVRSQSGGSSELMEVLNAEESCFKVAKWLHSCDKVASKDLDLPDLAVAPVVLTDPAIIKNEQHHQSLHYACVRVPTTAPQDWCHIYAEIQDESLSRANLKFNATLNPPKMDKRSPRGRSKSVSKKVLRSQSCKRSNSFVHLGPELTEQSAIQQPKSTSTHHNNNNNNSQKSKSSADITSHGGHQQRSGDQPERSRAASMSRRRSRVNSSSSWEVTRKPREDWVDSMWV